MKAYWNCEAEELKKNFQVSEEGLLPAQVEAIRREKGENVLQEGKRKVWRRCLRSSFATCSL